MYDQPNSLLLMQKKQLTWLLAMVFMVVVAAITFSAFLINTFVKGQVASALSQARPATVQVVPAAATTSSDSGCVAPGGQGSGEGASASTSTTSAFAGGIGGGMMGPAGPMAMLTGGRGSGLATSPSSTVNNSTVTTTITHTSTKSVNSGNTIGSNNGSNNPTTTTTNSSISNTNSYNQGSFNTASGTGDLTVLGPNTSTSSNSNTTTNDVSPVNAPVTTAPVTDSFDDSHDQVSTATNTTNTIASGNTISDNTLVLPLTTSSL
jgi:hypothetical protein